MKYDYKSILENLGYSLRDCGSHWRSAAFYREGNNPNCLAIYKDNGNFCDFKTNQTGNFEDLIALIKNVPIKEVKIFLKDGNFDQPQIVNKIIKIKENKIYPQELLKKLFNDPYYWVNRGLNKDILLQFNGGLAHANQMNSRYVFPIYNEKNQIVGFSGRYVFQLKEDSQIPKWKHIGRKLDWIYPRLSEKYIEASKTVILVESIGDILFLYQNNIKNCLCTFGTKLGKKLICYLVSKNVNKIIISTNNEPENKQKIIKDGEKIEVGNGIGNDSAFKIKEKLSHYFDENQIEIKLPIKKDFAEMSNEEILTWFKS